VEFIHQCKEFFHFAEPLAKHRHRNPRFFEHRFQPLGNSDVVANAFSVIAKSIFKGARMNFVVILARIFLREHFANQVTFKQAAHNLANGSLASTKFAANLVKGKWLFGREQESNDMPHHAIETEGVIRFAILAHNFFANLMHIMNFFKR
jgi:hypothetical protein